MRRRSVGHIVLSGLLGVMMPILWAVPGSADPKPTATGLYVPPPQPGALEQIDQLEADGDQAAADLIRKMVGQPQAVWVESGTLKQAEKQVKATMKAARHGKTVPVLVLYNIPFRDCAQFSAGEPRPSRSIWAG